ncbi:DUF3325 domain-containing protein [Aestuariibacter sp. AA17]|uniref:DUF3325 domain-containing protein n=1 Tax=Fluctibacter corallii TaxID=2984329 RepID=A0ABT3A870_9ALTE|nr:DUF3325 domain-containing protein [Aestuariibacter sp. AA17]MCV2884868.1 DUF3325 domain-containing protein [Aestuariibacter sp. AA17]
MLVLCFVFLCVTAWVLALSQHKHFKLIFSKPPTLPQQYGLRAIALASVVLSWVMLDVNSNLLAGVYWLSFATVSIMLTAAVLANKEAARQAKRKHDKRASNTSLARSRNQPNNHAA